MLQKPFFCFIILCLPALYADVQYEYSFGTPDIVNNEVRLKGCRTTRRGFAPMVAVKSVQIMLPLGHEAESFEVTFNEPVLLDGEYYLRPYIPNARFSKEINADLHAIRSPVYERNEFYPKSVRENWFSTQYKNGVPIFITSLNPVQYNPVTGKIKYFKSI